MQPLVTVITPVFNCEKFIKQTIESVLAQDYQNIEYIVLDDGSTDDTPKILADYSQKIKLFSHPNMGETKTVNKGFSLATGEYIIVVNSDDFLLQGAIRTGVKVLLDHPEAIVAYPDWVYIDTESKKISEIKLRNFDYIHMIKRHHCLVQSGAIFRRSVLEKCGFRDGSFKYVSDFDFWMRIGLYGTFIHIPETYGTFRIHQDSTSIKFKSLMANEDIRLIEKYYSLPELPLKILKVKREAFSRAYFHAAQNCEPDHLLAMPFYFKAFKFFPFTFLDIKVIVRMIDIYLANLLPKKIVQKLKTILKPYWTKINSF